MSLSSLSGPVKVERYKQRLDWQTQEPKEWKSGEPMEDVFVSVEGEDRWRRYFLHKSVNGSRAEVGQLVRLQLSSDPYQQIRKRKDGESFIATDYSDKVVGMEVVPSERSR